LTTTSNYHYNDINIKQKAVVPSWQLAATALAQTPISRNFQL
jgi:hypothetical protein